MELGQAFMEQYHLHAGAGVVMAFATCNWPVVGLGLI